MCVCERVCVCVRVCEREKEIETVCVRVSGRVSESGRDREAVKRGREAEKKTERGRERARAGV